MSTRAEPAANPDLEREWWLRVPAVLLAPRSVFAALRDDSDEAARARQEPITAIAGLAAIAVVLTTPSARRLLDDFAISAIVIPVVVFITGVLYAFVLYWLGGLFLLAGSRGLGSIGSYRRSRHLLGYAAVPLALATLTLWPLRAVVYGEDLFRSGGADHGAGDVVFGAVNAAFFAWAFVLLLIGVRTVHGWTWPRTASAVALAAGLPALVVVAAAGVL